MKKRFLSIFTVVTMLLTASLTGCKQEDYVATVDGERITKTEFTEVLVPMQIQMQMYYQNDNIWEEEVEGKSQKEVVKDEALDYIVYNKVQLKKAKEMGIDLTEEDKKTIDTNMEQIVKETGEEEFQARLTERNWTKDTLKKMMADQMIIEKLQKKILEEEQEKTYPDTVKASHILIKTVDDTMQPLPEAQQAEKKKKAEEALAKAKAGEDFNALIKAYNEDPGLEANGGAYVFGKGEMVPEFEKTAYALEVGQISNELVKTTYGYHIIKKLEKTEADKEKRKTSYIAQQQSLMMQGQPNAYDDVVTKWKEAVKVEKNKTVWDAIEVKKVDVKQPEQEQQTNPEGLTPTETPATETPATETPATEEKTTTE